MNDFYNVTGWPGQGAPGDSASGRTELSNIQTGFNKLAPITGNALKLIRNNASATAQEAVTPATATLETYADAQAGTHNILTTVAGTNTITATATPTLAAYVTNQQFQFAAAGANTGATTIAIDGLAAKNLVRPDGSALLAGDILGVGYECQIIIRAADAVLMNPVNQAKAVLAATVTSVAGATGNIAGQAGTVASVTGAAGNIAGSSGSCTGNAATANSAATATSAAGLNGQSMAALGTGIVKNTTGTGVPSIAIAGDFPTLNQNTTGSSASCTGNAATATLATNVTGSAAVTGAVTSSSPSSGIGYAAGAGGSVTQITSGATAVTLNKICGEIVTFDNSFPKWFLVNNSTVSAGDVVIPSPSSGIGGDVVSRILATATILRTGGGFYIYMSNPEGSIQGANPSKVNFAVIKSVAA